MNRSRASRRQRADPRVVIPSVSAAAHCAQSCLRFWNLLLQDAASVNPFGMSSEGYDRTEEDEEEAEAEEEEEAEEGGEDADHNESQDNDAHGATIGVETEAEAEAEAEDGKQVAKQKEEGELEDRKPQIEALVGGKREEKCEVTEKEATNDNDDDDGDDKGGVILYGTYGVPMPHPEASYMRPRTVHWWNHHVGFAREDDPSYADVFRLPVGFLVTVCDLCREDMQQGDIPMSLRLEGRVMSVERQVAIAVTRLSTGNTLKTVSELLSCGRSTVVKIVTKFVAAVRRRAGFYLQWPSSSSPEHSLRVKEGFLNKHGLLNCCGALDSSHIIMELPSGEPADIWVDKNHNFSMVLQAVIDTELRFLDVCVGYPGSMNDTRCLKESAFYKKCINGQRLNGDPMPGGDLSIGEYVVADSEYPLLPWLMRPYKEHEITPQRAFYNDKLFSTRIAIARAFGRLKGTWRMFHGIVKQPNIERMPKMIHACCIMHNMCIEFGGVEGVHFPEPEVIVQVEDTEKRLGDAEEETEEAKQVRENLSTYLNSLSQL